MPERIAVIGGGVIGLSTAVLLAEQGAAVTLITGQPAEKTTSAVAAAFWSPYWIGDYDHAWAEQTLVALQELATVPGTGVTIEPAEEWLDAAGSIEVDAELEETYWWRHLPGLNWTRKPIDPPREIQFPESHEEILMTEKISFQAPVARMPDYLSYLRNRFLAFHDSHLEVAWVDSLEGLLSSYSLVVHCTGWQSLYLVPEERTGARPMRLLAGHVNRVPLIPGHPLVTLSHGAFRNRSTYIVPRRGAESGGSEGDMICGGTAIEIQPPENRDAQLTGDESLCQSIMQRCAAFEPRLLELPVTERLLGLRPVRHAVRVERDPNQPRIIHHYGHGGSGLTLSWGSAQHACQLVLDSQSISN